MSDISAAWLQCARCTLNGLDTDVANLIRIGVTSTQQLVVWCPRCGDLMLSGPAETALLPFIRAAAAAARQTYGPPPPKPKLN